MSLTATAPAAGRSFGEHLRDWRKRRRLSQMDMALEAEISTRHLSFLETGRAKPSREMVLKLAERLEAPLKDRNALLLAAGFAPVFGERGLEHPALENVRVAVGEWLAAHEPYPALAIDRRWNVVGTNAAVGVLLAGVDAELLKPPVNVLKLSLHPGGLARRILNLAEWRTHLFHRLRRELDAGGDPELATLARELEVLPGPAPRPGREAAAEVLTPLVLAAPDGTELSLITTTAVFGTPLDVTVSELMLETLLPADAATRAWFARR